MPVMTATRTDGKGIIASRKNTSVFTTNATIKAKGVKKPFSNNVERYGILN